MRKWINDHVVDIVATVVITVVLGALALVIAKSVQAGNIERDFGKRCEAQSGNVFYNKYFRICVKDDRVITKEDY